MNAVLDVVAAIRDLLEPPSQMEVDVDETGAEPVRTGKGTFYCYPEPGRLRELAFESGPTARQEFVITAAFMEPSSESAQQLRDADISAALDERLGRWLAAIRSNRSTVFWHHLAAAARPAPRKLTGRGIALEISGYRFVG